MPPNLYATRYEYADGTEDQRDRTRPAHVQFLQALHRTGVLVASGRLEDQRNPGALIIVKLSSIAAAAAALNADPFWAAGVIETRDIRHWNVAFGTEKFE